MAYPLPLTTKAPATPCAFRYDATARDLAVDRIASFEADALGRAYPTIMVGTATPRS
jgi:hypothetical protein